MAGQFELTLNPSTCKLLQNKTQSLGHVVSEEGAGMDPGKVSVVKLCHTPQNLPKLRAFLGTFGYYHRYVEDFATLAGPLAKITCNNNPFGWEPEKVQAFRSVKDRLTSPPIS